MWKLNIASDTMHTMLMDIIVYYVDIYRMIEQNTDILFLKIETKQAW